MAVEPKYAVTFVASLPSKITEFDTDEPENDSIKGNGKLIFNCFIQ